MHREGKDFTCKLAWIMVWRYIFCIFKLGIRILHFCQKYKISILDRTKSAKSSKSKKINILLRPFQITKRFLENL